MLVTSALILTGNQDFITFLSHLVVDGETDTGQPKRGLAELRLGAKIVKEKKKKKKILDGFQVYEFTISYFFNDPKLVMTDFYLHDAHTELRGLVLHLVQLQHLQTKKKSKTQQTTP